MFETFVVHLKITFCFLFKKGQTTWNIIIFYYLLGIWLTHTLVLFVVYEKEVSEQQTLHIPVKLLLKHLRFLLKQLLFEA